MKNVFPKLALAMMLASPLTACDRVSRDDAQALKTENDRLAQENQDLKIRIARLEERAKTVTTAAAAVTKPKPKSTATKAPETASPAEKEALTEAVTGGGSFK